MSDAAHSTLGFSRNFPLTLRTRNFSVPFCTGVSGWVFGENHVFFISFSFLKRYDVSPVRQKQNDPLQNKGDTNSAVRQRESFLNLKCTTTATHRSARRRDKSKSVHHQSATRSHMQICTGCLFVCAHVCLCVCARMWETWEGCHLL